MLQTHAIGIELGATHSSISYLNEHGEPVTIPNRDGELSIPSVVDFHGDRIVVGTEALRNSAKYPGKVVVHAKGYMGDPSHRWRINGKSYSPIDISTLILKSMLDYAHERIGAINQAVITVPARCSDVQRQATVEAGKRAGLKRVDLVDEPVATALCFVLGTEGIWFTNLATTQNIMVVSLADDMFDVSIVRYHKNEAQVIASAGYPRLGELNWNKTLEVVIARQFQKEFGIDPTKDRVAAQALALEAEQAKRCLSVRPQAALTCAAGGQRKTYKVELEQFERLCSDLLLRIEMVVLDFLKQNNLSWSKIDVVLATGGASRLPMVRSLIKKLSGRTLNTSLSSDQSIAHGACFSAGMLLKNAAFSVNNPARAQYETARPPMSNLSLVETEESQSRSPSAPSVSGNSGSAIVRKKYLTLDEAAAFLGITNDKMLRLREVAAVPGFSDRGTWRFKTSDIESYRQRVLPQSTVNTRGRLEEFALPTIPRDVHKVPKFDVDSTPPIGEASRPSLTAPRASATPTVARNVETTLNVVQRSASWDALVQSHTTPDAWALVPICELAGIEGIPQRLLLSRNECLAISSAADRLGFALEPDFRITGQCYWWDERVSVFPRDDAVSGELASYRAASTLLRLGMTVALADGEVDEAEMARLFSHLKSQFTLSEHDSVRLDHLRYLLTKTRQVDPKLAERLCKQLDIAKRRELGKFLISIAAADGEVSIHERSVLDAIYRDLGIPHLLAAHLAEINPTKSFLPKATRTTIANQALTVQPNAANETAAAPPPMSALITPAIPPADKPSTHYDWLAHLATGYYQPSLPVAKPTSLDHERIRHLDEEREKQSQSLSEATHTRDALVEIRPPSTSSIPSVLIPPEPRHPERVQPEPATPPDHRAVELPAANRQPITRVTPVTPATVQLVATNEVATVTPPKSALVASVMAPADKLSKLLAHVATGDYLSSPPASKPASLDHERIQREAKKRAERAPLFGEGILPNEEVESERNKRRPPSFGEGVLTNEALVEIRPPSISNIPSVLIPPEPRHPERVHPKPATPPDHRAVESPAANPSRGSLQLRP